MTTKLETRRFLLPVWHTIFCLAIIATTSGHSAGPKLYGTNNPPQVSLANPFKNSIWYNHNNILLNASASDPDGFIKTLDFWAGSLLLARQTNVNNTIGSTNVFTYTWTNVPAGIYEIKAIATDDAGASTISGTNLIQVLNTNNLPYNSGPAVSMTSPTTGSSYYYPSPITAVARASDSDGYIVQVRFWEHTTPYVLHPCGEVYNFDQTVNLAKDFTFVFTNLSVGRHLLFAQATDNTGGYNNSPDIEVFVVSPSVYTPVINLLSPPNNAVYATNADINFLASVYDIDGYVPVVNFYRGYSLIGSVTNVNTTAGGSNIYAFTWRGAPSGSNWVYARAIDDGGLIAYSITNSIQVGNGEGNQAPSVSMISPTNGSTYKTNVVQLVAQATDPDGYIRMIDFLDGSNRLATITNTDTTIGLSKTYNYNWRIAPGTHQISARAMDNYGVATVSPVLTVIGLASYSPMTRMLSPVSSSIFPSNATVELVALAGDRDGWIQTLEFRLLSNTIAILTNTDHTVGVTNQYSYVWPNLAPGVYQVTATATDNDGNQTTSGNISFTVGTVTNFNNPTNLPLPCLTITSPIDWTRYLPGVPLSFQIQATPFNAAPINYVELYDGLHRFSLMYRMGMTNSIPFTFTWTNPPAGDHLIMARGVTYTGQAVVSPTIHIVGTSATELPPQGIFNSGMPGRPAEVYFYVPAGYNYTVEGSTNLLSWALLTNLYCSGGIIWFTDANATNTANQFYRAIQRP